MHSRERGRKEGQGAACASSMANFCAFNFGKQPSYIH